MMKAADLQREIEDTLIRGTLIALQTKAADQTQLHAEDLFDLMRDRARELALFLAPRMRTRDQAAECHCLICDDPQEAL